MLHYHNVDFEFVPIKLPMVEGSPGKDWETIQEDMKKSGNYIKEDTPFLEDGDVYLVESTAIAKYCARKTGCIAKTEKELQSQDQAEGILSSFMERLANLRWGPEGEKMDEQREVFKQRMADKLSAIERLINKNGGRWICGETLTWVDFFVIRCFESAKKLDPTINETLGTLRGHLERLRENEGFNKYYESVINIETPLVKWDFSREQLGISHYKPKFM